MTKIVKIMPSKPKLVSQNKLRGLQKPATSQKIKKRTRIASTDFLKNKHFKIIRQKIKKLWFKIGSSR